MTPFGRQFFSHIRKGQKTVTREDTLEALHVVVCGSLNEDNVLRSDVEPALMLEKAFRVDDGDGLPKILMNVMNILGAQRTDMNQYYVDVKVWLNTSGDGAAGDDMTIEMVSDSAGSPAMASKIISYGEAGVTFNPLDITELPCAYNEVGDHSYSQLQITHLGWIATETHVTNIMVRVWKRPTEPDNGVIS